MGAAADISKADNRGFPPLRIAIMCSHGLDHVDVCEWLIFNGALHDADEETIEFVARAMAVYRLYALKWGAEQHIFQYPDGRVLKEEKESEE